MRREIAAFFVVLFLLVAVQVQGKVVCECEILGIKVSIWWAPWVPLRGWTQLPLPKERGLRFQTFNKNENEAVYFMRFFIARNMTDALKAQFGEINTAFLSQRFGVGIKQSVNWEQVAFKWLYIEALIDQLGLEEKYLHLLGEELGRRLIKATDAPPRVRNLTDDQLCEFALGMFADPDEDNRVNTFAILFSDAFGGGELFQEKVERLMKGVNGGRLKRVGIQLQDYKDFLRAWIAGNEKEAIQIVIRQKELPCEAK